MKRGNFPNQRTNYNYRNNTKKSSSQSQLNSPIVNNMQTTDTLTTAGGSSITGSFNLEEMVTYIRENPSVALGVHHQLIQTSVPNHTRAPIDSSTPQTTKRNLDLSGSDAAQVSKQRRVLPNGKENNNNQPNKSIIQNVNNRQVYQQERRLPFDQLKRAVASNLPCFLIEYEQTDNSKNRPSDVSAANLIEEHFKKHGIPITFSLVGHAGNKLKLGVNNKESYASLMSTDNWPPQINNVNIKVIKPKFIPDSFALVVRYVPLQYNDDYVQEEIERNLQSAVNIRRINYRFERRSNDYRFIVKDNREYNSTLKLGRISIGNSLCTITPFLAGNRMTYCTRCWCLGHMRDKCNLDYPRCRVCLDSIIEGQPHECSNVSRCAQCDGPHHSLSNECEKVTQYRADLKEQVNSALSAGKLQRVLPEEHSQQPSFRLNQNEFQPLPQPAAPWIRAAVQPSAAPEAIEIGNDDTTKMLLSLHQNIAELKGYFHRIDEKLDKANQIALDTEIHHETLVKLMPTILSIIQDIIWPMTNSNINATELKELRTKLQGYFTSIQSLSSHLNSDYSSRRKRSISPLPHLSLTEETSDPVNTSRNNETDQNMSK